ncbi:hypothetical protein [Kitasatospora sp. NBC_01266]|uniref:hypothetical protein n=1 Tax=Kitasatospora sp. NBC_01266 TaxID=2903572 RepID=UPI002E323121|nr:hypothetical protein [Kitasatospora sp. NBC_01266]
MPITIWRGPDGQHWSGEEGDADFDPAARVWVYRLVPAVRDPATGRWATDPAGEPVDVMGFPEQAGYTEVCADPLGEPRIARLHELLADLLTDYQLDAGRPHPRTTELHTALEDVAALPDQLRRHGYAAAAQAA